MNKKVIFFLILLCVWFMVNNIFSFPIERIPNSFLVRALVDYRGVELCILKQEDESYQKIKKLLVDNENGWGLDINTYAPVLELSSENMKITIQHVWSVNFNHPTFGWIQLSKVMPTDITFDNICNIKGDLKPKGSDSID